MVMTLLNAFTTRMWTTIHFLKPVKEICLGFMVTGYVIYKIPISAEARAKSKLSDTQIVLKCVSDEAKAIKTVLLNWADVQQFDLILTTGGTGFSPRDVTPEATRSVLDKEAPGLVIAMITKSLEVTQMAMLSRPVCGVRKKSMIINLPGSRKGSQECLGFILPVLNHAIDLLQDCTERVTATHNVVQSTGSSSNHHHHVCPHHHSKSHGESVVGGRTREEFYPVSQRPRQSPYQMLSVDEAIKIILEQTPCPTATTQVDLFSGLHCVLAADVVASDPLPPFPASIKDGYAVISSDGPGERHVLSPISAGDTDSSSVVSSGTVCRITTGAPLPKGADAVIMVENTKLVSASEDGTEEKVVEILVSSKPGQDIRPIGCDVMKGQTVLEKSGILGASEIGIAAAAGIDTVTVYKMPRVGVLSTGNEVMEPGTTLQPGKIYDSNRYSLLAMLKERNCVGIDLGIANDTREELVKQINQALEEADVLITTGGVSMGEKDLLKPVLVKEFGATIHFGRVFMKPGKPTTFASLERNNKRKLVFALPGNPVSAMVTFELFVFPALKKLSGWNKTEPTIIPTKVSFPIRLDPRPEYHRVKLVWGSGGVPMAMSTGSQVSSRLLSMKEANALLVLPPKTDSQSTISVGDTVRAILIHRSLY